MQKTYQQIRNFVVSSFRQLELLVRQHFFGGCMTKQERKDELLMRIIHFEETCTNRTKKLRQNVA